MTTARVATTHAGTRLRADAGSREAGTTWVRSRSAVGQAGGDVGAWSPYASVSARVYDGTSAKRSSRVGARARRTTDSTSAGTDSPIGAGGPGSAAAVSDACA